MKKRMIIKSQNIPRTMRVRDSILKTYSYLKAIFKIESKETESLFFNQIIQEGIEEVKKLNEQGKQILVSSYRGKRYVIGGNLSEETNEQFNEIVSEFNWGVQESVEVLIYFSSLKRLSKNEQKFFGLSNLNIVVLD